MRVPSKIEFIFLPLLSIFLVAGCGNNTQASGNPDSGSDKPGLLGRIFETTKPITVSEGTMLDVVLNQSISTAQNRSGDTFQATLASSVVVDDKTVIPKDAIVRGHVVDAQPSGRLKGVAHLELTLDSIEVDGASYEIANRTLTKASGTGDVRDPHLHRHESSHVILPP